MDRIVPFFGIAIMIVICLAFSTDRREAVKRWPLIAWGFGLQFIFALIILKTEAGEKFFGWCNNVFMAIISVTEQGTGFVFNGLGIYSEGGFSFAFQVLPIIIFFSALTSILYHLGVLQIVVKLIAWVMQKTMKTSGAETLSASANIFVGQTEAPLLVRPFINKMTQSELTTVMTGGFATIAGSVLAAYVLMLKDTIPGIAGHLLAASVMSAPAALVFGKLFVPETETPETLDTLHVTVERESTNLFDAATLGTTEGIRLAINVGGMLIAFLAIIGLVDLALTTLGGLFFEEGALPAWWSLRGFAGYVFSPLAYFMGVTEWGEAVGVGQLMGVKMVANEFVAYADLQAMLAPDSGVVLSERAQVISTYALCGFANLGSIGIQIGGLAVMAPERRVDLSRLAFRAMIAGTFACCSTACIAAILLPTIP